MSESKVKETSKYKDIATARENIYKFLSTCYLQEPSEKFVKDLTSVKFIKSMSEIFPGTVLSPLKNFAKGYKGDFESVKQDFHDLFMVPLNKFVTPYESVYKEKLMGQQTTIKVAKQYLDAGAGVNNYFGASQKDHIGLELDFMRFLCKREAESWKKGRSKSARSYLNKQKIFLSEHLTTWAGELTKNIENKSETGLYKTIARMTKKYLTNDLKEVKVILKETLQ